MLLAHNCENLFLVEGFVFGYTEEQKDSAKFLLVSLNKNPDTNELYLLPLLCHITGKQKETMEAEKLTKDQSFIKIIGKVRFLKSFIYGVKVERVNVATHVVNNVEDDKINNFIKNFKNRMEMILNGKNREKRVGDNPETKK